MSSDEGAYSAQRRYPRHRVRIPLYVSLPDTTYRKLIPVESRDISAGGIGFETSRGLPLESSSSLVVSGLGGLPDAAAVKGVVVHSRRDEASGRYSVGVEFTEFVLVTREQLEAAIAAWEQRASA